MLDFKKTEKEVLEFWEKKKIYEKVKKKNAKGKKFYFLQGPPYTSGKIHIGHAWNNSMKDIILRYKRMKGLNVWDRAGYDMHGLPTENKVQQKLGFKDKDEILKYGIDKFVKECAKFSIEHAKYMNEDLAKLGVWMDFENSYMPISKEYMEGEWALIKKAWEQKRLYKGKKIMHWDAQSETSLAKHELEYETVKDTSIFLKFKIKNKKDEYFLVWTTTPWTVTFNLGIMVNPEINYVKARVEKEVWIIAKDLAGMFISGLLGKKYEIIDEFKGEKLEGTEYVHPLYNDLKEIYDNLKKEWKNVHTIFLSKEYVDTSAGTGLVHSAPGCGPEDYEVGKRYGVGAFNTLNEKGEIENRGKFTGMIAKEDDKKFIDEFKKVGSLITTTEVEHEYPMSWRSHKPVVFRPTEQWFLKIEDLTDKLLKFNEKIYWVPKRTKESYERWTENLKDNGITRQRFWGCPAPIWTCECGKVEVIGSEKELSKRSGKNLSKIDLHRHWIDEVKLKCNKCKKQMSRIPDVIDVWIDSGTASWNCLYNDKKLIKEYFPADLILEATEQTKLWFSMLQICSAIMMGKSSYKNVFVHGMILDFGGTKMSKSLGNVISPYEVIDKYSSDILRYYICQTSAGENINFSWEDIKVKQKNLMILVNIANYISDLEKQKIKKGRSGIEEMWITSRYHSTLKRVTELFENYRLDETIKEIEDLYLCISRDYIKLIREKSSENKAVLETLREIHLGILKMFSTVCPFFSDHLCKKMNQKEESVHLCDWPKADNKKINMKLEEEFAKVMKIIELGLGERDKAKIGLRWPLAKATIYTKDKINNDLKEIIERQLNVKDVIIKSSEEFKIELDFEITEELESEGFAREVARKIQSERKNAGLKKGELIELNIATDGKLKNMLEKYSSFLKERTNSKSISFVVDKIPEKFIKFKVKEREIGVKFL